jgi:hypothetical protein
VDGETLGVERADFRFSTAHRTHIHLVGAGCESGNARDLGRHGLNAHIELQGFEEFFETGGGSRGLNAVGRAGWWR